MIEFDPAIKTNFRTVLEDHTAGDPMRLELKWTSLSRRQIAKRLKDLGTPVSRHVVSQLLKKHGYGRRKALKKKTMGPRHPDRNTQFENIARLKKVYLKAGLPVISIDTKKKELMGDFYRDGLIETQATIEVNDHDFGSMVSDTVIPHGIYDVGRNEGFVHLNTSHDTSEFACDSIERFGGRARAGTAIPERVRSCRSATVAGATAPVSTCSRKTCNGQTIGCSRT